MKLQVIENQDYVTSYDDRRRRHLASFSDSELRQKMERITQNSRWGKNRAKLSERMRQRLDAKLETVSAEAMECYELRWEIATSITKQERLQLVIIKLIKTEQRIRRLSDELYERSHERPRLRLLVNEDITESAGIRALRANMRAWDRRNKGDK